MISPSDIEKTFFQLNELFVAISLNRSPISLLKEFHHLLTIAVSQVVEPSSSESEVPELSFSCAMDSGTASSLAPEDSYYQNGAEEELTPRVQPETLI
jgi:hypothetical protein